MNRVGEVEYVIVGDERSIFIPDLPDYPLGRKLLRGLRLLHTHLKGEALNDDDLTDLALLRFDLLAAISTPAPDLPPVIQLAHLIVPGSGPHPYRVEQITPLARLSLNLQEFLENLEKELATGTSSSREIAGSEERGKWGKRDTGDCRIPKQRYTSVHTSTSTVSNYLSTIRTTFDKMCGGSVTLGLVTPRKGRPSSPRAALLSFPANSRERIV